MPKQEVGAWKISSRWTCIAALAIGLSTCLAFHARGQTSLEPLQPTEQGMEPAAVGNPPNPATPDDAFDDGAPASPGNDTFDNKGSAGPAAESGDELTPIAGGGVASDTDADWRSEQRLLRLGVVSPAGAARALPLLAPFVNHLRSALGIRIHLEAVPDMRMLLDGLANGRIDYAPLSASAYAAGWTLCRCIEPVAVPLDGNGSAGFHSVVIARADAGLRRLVDLKGGSLAYSSPSSVAGFLVPRAGFRSEGAGDGAFFSETFHAAGPRAAVRMMLEGKADAAVGWSTMEGSEDEGYSRGTLTAMVEGGEVSMADVRILWQSPEIPNGAHAVRSNLPAPLKSLLSATLLDLSESDPEAYDAVEPVYGGGFAAIGHEAFAPLLNVFGPR